MSATVQEADLGATLREIDAQEFGEFVADLWRAQGWEPGTAPGSSDGDVDVPATGSKGVFERRIGANDLGTLEQRIAIEVKGAAGDDPVTGSEVEECYARWQRGSVDTVVVVTRSSFSGGAHERADGDDLKLVDGDDLVELVELYDCYDLLDEYASEVVTEAEKVDARGRVSDPRVEEIREIVHEPDDWEARKQSWGWKHAWHPSRAEKKTLVAAIAIGGVLFAAVGEAFDAAAGAGAVGLLVGAVAGHAGAGRLRTEGRGLIREYHDQIHDDLTGQVERQAREMVAADSPVARAHAIKRAEAGAVTPTGPARYEVVVVVATAASLSVVENAWIDLERVEYHAGEVTHEFDHDEVRRIDGRGGSFTIRLTSGLSRSWVGFRWPDGMVPELQRRIWE